MLPDSATAGLWQSLLAHHIPALRLHCLVWRFDNMGNAGHAVAIASDGTCQQSVVPVGSHPRQPASAMVAFTRTVLWNAVSSVLHSFQRTIRRADRFHW